MITERRRTFLNKRPFHIIVSGFLLTGILVLSAALPLSQKASAAEVLDIGPGARSIGLGRAYVGMYGDGYAVFGNPASLYGIDRAQILSMYGELTQDVKFTMLGYAVPTQNGAFGFGYASNKAWDLTSTTVDAHGRVVPLTNFNAGNDMYIFEYANKINNKWSVGGRFKYNVKGSSTVNGTGTGMNADLGVLYSVDDKMKAGLVISNALLGDLGAIRWSNGYVEQQGMGIDLGLGFSKERSSVYGELSSRPGIPIALKVGSEWQAWDNLLLRIGIEQKSVSNSDTYLNYSLGVGYRFKDLNVDYAYYYDGLLPYNSRHFVGFAFLLPTQVKGIELKSDKYVTTNSEAVTIKGAVSDDVKKLMVGQVEATVTSGRFVMMAPVEVGKNTVTISALNEAGKPVATDSVKVLRLKAFNDISDSFWAKDPIRYFGTLGIAGGLTRSTQNDFKPGWSINRAEIVSLLCSAKGVQLSPIKKSVFTDVPVSQWASADIDYAVSKGWVAGYSDKTFRPQNTVTRAEGVAIIARYADLKPAVAGRRFYSDLPDTYWALPVINAAKNAHVLDFIDGDTFGPDKLLTRAEMCSMLSKIPPISDEIKDLLDFSTGY